VKYETRRNVVEKLETLRGRFPKQLSWFDIALLRRAEGAFVWRACTEDAATNVITGP
jgi:hypothetical protein